MGKRKPAHHRGAHQQRARRLINAILMIPGYRCPRCGLTLTEGLTRWGANGEWEAGHVNAGQINGPLRAEHRHCNRSHGATLGNARRSTGYDWP